MNRLAAVILMPLLMAGTVAASTVVVLAFPADAFGTFPGKNGRIAFDRNGSIYTVAPNGNGLTLIAQADVVLIRIGNGDLGGDARGYFSTGVQQPEGDPAPKVSRGGR